MVKTTSCPQPGDLQKLATGHLPAAELETLVQHLESCGSCLAKVQTFASTDTLVDALIKGSTQTNGPEEPLVARLVDRLSKLAQAPPPAPGLLAFACAKCGKSLKVKPTMAGKKVKCPGCGAVVAAPAAAAAAPANVEDMRTLPPAPNPEAPTIAPSPSGVGENPTNPPLSKPDQTMAGKPAATGHDASLTDFLSPPQAADELGRLGKYRILKILGHGGMGVVYKGEDLKLKRTVAIKAMLPTLAASASAGKRFMREAEAMAAVEHDHIVRIYQVDDERGIPFMAMEFLKGEPLDERLKHPEPIPLPDNPRIGREIAEGLGAAHATGLIHRDIKPGNIWLEAARGLAFGAADANAKPQAAGRVKILDFGLARAASQDSGLTQQGAIIGTPAYMAPEQGRGDNVDARCDLFSLGVVLYRMCTGEQPFRGTDTVSTLMAVAMTDPPPPIKLNDGLPHELSDLVMKLLEKDLAKRIGTAAEVVHALQGMEKHLARQKMDEDKTAALATTPVQPGEPSRVSGRLKMASTGPSRGSARRPFALIAIGLVALFSVFCLLGAGGIYYWQTNNGLVKIEINDPAIKVAFDKNGPIITGVDQKDIKLTPGEFGLTVERGDLKFDTDKFILKRGETITLKIEWFKEGKLQVVQGEKVLGAKQIAEKAVPRAAGNFALAFDGKASYVSFPSLDYKGGTPLTIEAWAVFEGPPPEANSVEVLLGDPQQSGINIHVTSGPFRLGFRVWQKEGPVDVVQRQLLERGKLLHVAGVYVPGAETLFFVEGKLQGKAAAKGIYKSSSWRFVLGAKPGPTGASGEHLHGRVQGVRVSKVARYDKDFTPAKRFEPDADTLALYHCDEGSGDVLKDSSGSGHHGKIVGAKWVKVDGTPIVPLPSVPGFALRFDGDAQVAFPKLPLAGKQPFTLEAWATADSNDLKRQAYIIDLPRLAELRTNFSGSSWTLLHLQGNTGVMAPSGPEWNKPVHLAGVSTGNEIFLFVHGKLVGRKEIGKEAFKALKNNVLGEKWLGLIGEVRISKVARYDKDFKPAQRFEPDADTLALYHCDEGSGDVLKDSSGNGHHGKIVGAKWVKVDGTPVAAKWALQFDGTGYVRVDAKAPVTAKKFTVEAWVNPAGLGMVYSNLFDNTMGGGTLLGTWARKNDGSACWAWNVNKHSVLYLHRESKDACIFGKWVHVAGVYDGSSFDLYLNGRRQNTPGHSAAIEFPLIGFYIGKSLFGDKVTPLGKVSAFRISKVARYTKDFTPAQRFEPDADTLALYHFDEGSGDVLKDSSGNGHHGKIVGAKWVKADGAPVSPFPPLDPAWLKAVAALPAKEQVEAVKAELMKRNPGFDGTMKAQIQSNKAIYLTFNTDHVKDISPVAVFIELRRLSCCGSYPNKGQLADLSPLRGLSKLDVLSCYDNPVSDLSPLQDTNLGSLGVYRTLVADLSPLKKLKLVDLHCHIAKVTDLSPIKEMPLRNIGCDFNAERDDAILRSIKTLETINGKPAAEFWKEVDAGKIGALAAKKQQEEWAVKLKAPVEATNKLGMKLILIPPAGAALPKPYYLGKYEVSQGEWEQVMDYNPSAFGPKHPKMAGLDTSKFPVEQVSWFDSVEFCNKLSVREGLKPYYALTVTKRIADGGTQIDEADVKILGGSGYHIPTDAEWEHGCRAGTKTKYHCGDKDEDLLEYAWFGMNSDGRAHAVGGKKPNAFGLYDMHGNVGEWNEEMLMNATSGAPERAFRGGNWPFAAGNCAVTFRWRSGPAIRSNNCGLRVARVP